MDLRHLRYFLFVAEEMHFGRAARRLGISQPPLSKQIRLLEEELGVMLFDRTSRRVRLTEAGRLFEPEARQALRQAERAAETARLAQKGEIGRLRLGFTTSGPFVPMIASALYRYRHSHPAVELQLVEQGSDDQIDAIREGRLDIGIIRDFRSPVLPDGMVAHRLLREEMILAIRADHTLAKRAEAPRIADLAGEALVLYGAPAGSGFTDHFFALCEAEGFQPLIAHEARSLATLLGLVAAGFGPTVLAQSMARLHVEDIVTRAFSTPIHSSLWLIHYPDLPPTGAAFRQTILEKHGNTNPNEA
jgi:DNA-binding transcriptional LysR family regulator